MVRLPRLGLATLTAATLLGCSGTSTAGNGSQVAPEPVYQAPQTNIASVSGYAWDPESFWFSVATCGSNCPFSPVIIPGSPSIERSLISGMFPGLIDPVTGQPAVIGQAPTGSDGAWSFNGITSRPYIPFFAMAAPPPQGVPLPPPSLSADATIPPGNYLPTVALKPIYTGYTECVAQSVPVASDDGILEAVAKLRTAMGQATSPYDFIDPTKFGGVIISWLYQPISPFVRVPAFAAQTTADRGDVFQIGWAPPGLLPAAANQSTRGFFVTNDPSQSIGATVILLPPLMGPPQPVTLTAADPVQAPTQGRPWSFQSLPPIVAAPGVISYLELEGDIPNSPPPPPSFCLNPGA